MKVLRRVSARFNLLNVPLLLVFVAAWVSDRWPELTAPAIIAALIIIIAEVSFLYIRTNRTAKEHYVEDITSSRINSNPNIAIKARTEANLQSIDSIDSHRSYDLPTGVLLEEFRLHFFELSSRKEKEIREKLTRNHYYAFTIAQPVHLRTALPDELAKRKLSKHGQNAFNILAGAFEIDYFHGHTNIKVLDPSRVTIESKIKDKNDKSEEVFLPSDLRTTVYH